MRFIQAIAIAWVVVLMALVAVELVYFAFAATYERIAEAAREAIAVLKKGLS